MPETHKNQRKRPDTSPLTRTLSLRAEEVEELERSVELSFSSEEPYERWFGPEILWHGRGAVNLERLREVGSVLRNHDPDQPVATILRAWVDREEKKGRAVVRFGTTKRAEETFQEVKEGLIRGISVGYRVQEWKEIEEGKSWKGIEGRAWVARKWTPIELTFTPVPADGSVGVGRSLEPEAPAGMEKENKEMEDTSMPKKEEEKRKEQQAATPETRPESPSPASAEERVDAEKVRQEALRAERERILEIQGACRDLGLEHLADGFIRDGLEISQVNERLLQELRAKKAPASPPQARPGAEITEDERDKFRSASVDGLLIRSGLSLEKPAPGAEDLAGLTLRELARECLVRAGLPTRGSMLEWIGRAITHSTSDFPHILANVANKALFAGYSKAEETWQTWCATGSVSDFKTNYLVRPGEGDDLDEVPESGEYKYGTRGEAQETYSIATYGKLFSLTRQTIINDDLAALSDVPRMHGEAAARKVGDLAYAVLTSNPTMGDSHSLFDSSNHGNVGTAGAVSTTTIAEAIALMKLQKDIDGKKRLNIRPRFFLAPVALEGSAEVFFRSDYFDATAKDATRVNPYAGTYFKRVYEARLDDASSTAWYLAGPTGKTVTLFFLNGQQTPYMETRNGWTVDGIEYKVRIDAGAKAVDWRALVKNAGA